MNNPFDDLASHIDLKLNDLRTQLEDRLNAIQPISDEIIDQNELAKRLKIAKSTIIDRQKKGMIPFFRIGSSVRYNWRKVLEKLET